MYLNYWGFQVYPYEISPDPKFIFYSRDHEEAMTRLLYAVHRKRGAALLTGEIGCGKTTLSRALIQQLPKHKYNIGLIANPNLQPTDFLKETLLQFGLNPGTDSKVDLLNMLGEMILQDFRKGLTTLLIIDEAQLVPPETFEEVRLLLNYQLNDQFLLSLILIGQPELRGIIRRVEQLDQRIAIRYHLGALSFDQTVKYILFRLSKAGLIKNVFTDDALRTIYDHSRGVPRKINNICDMSLLIGFGMKIREIDVDVIQEAVRDTSCEGENGTEGGYILESKSFILPTVAS
jgi:general secretion pathway protein A